MRVARPVLAFTLALGLMAWLAGPRLAAQTTPAAPADVAYLVNGSALSITWTHTVDSFTHYVIDVASAAGAPPFLRFPTSTFVDPGKLPQMLASISANSGPANYFISIRAANGAAIGPAAPEVNINIPGGCKAPGTPNNLTSIVRGSQAYIAWNPGSGGLASSYILQASVVSGANFASGIVAQLPVTAPTFNVGVPGGPYYVRTYATNACGTSGVSNEITVTAGVDTPATTPNPPSGRLPEFDMRATVDQLQNQAIARGLMAGSVSCPSRPGYPDSNIEARKVNLNGYINYLVDNLRLIDRRFGYNAKPTRASLNPVVAGDEFIYHFGADAFEQSPNVYLVDALGGHCTLGNESKVYRAFYDEFGRATSAGRFIP